MTDMSFRDYATNSIRFWERGRVLYNAVLLTVLIAAYLSNMPASKEALGFDFAWSFFIWAILANICFCSAYPVDLLVQASHFRDVWLRYRWVLLAIGVVFASLLAYTVSVYSLFAAPLGPD